MRTCAGELSDLLHTLSHDMLTATRCQADVEFAVSVVRLQTEMATSYAHELQRLEQTGEASIAHEHTGTSVRALSACLVRGIPGLIGMLEDLDGRFSEVRPKVTVLARELGVLRALHCKARSKPPLANAPTRFRCCWTRSVGRSPQPTARSPI